MVIPSWSDLVFEIPSVDGHELDILEDTTVVVSSATLWSARPATRCYRPKEAVFTVDWASLSNWAVSAFPSDHDEGGNSFVIHSSAVHSRAYMVWQAAGQGCIMMRRVGSIYRALVHKQESQARELKEWGPASICIK
ncbi:unnamed protein product [Cuscuta campestris]|uniref:Uncharacterized protein n=1 Tax=Cuscuta campestris TaxID=132261 RepID=A0A484LCN5_9ASTE|nr:unnamed protein product [Cuscuta campestris]